MHYSYYYLVTITNGTFTTADSAEALATAAAGVLDDSVVSALARATGVAADSVEQVVQGGRRKARAAALKSSTAKHCLHRGSISQRVHSGQSPSLSPVRDIDLNVLCPARDAQLRQLPEPRDLFDSSAAGMCPPGSPMAFPRRTDMCGSPSQSAPAGGPPPFTTEAPLPRTSLATVHCPREPPESAPTTDLAPVTHRL